MRRISQTIFIIAAVFFVSAFALAESKPFYFTAPAGDLPAQINKKKDLFVLPNGRMLTPWGKQYMLPPHPYGLAISKNGKTAAALQTTNKPNYVALVKDLDTDKPRVIQIRADKMTLTGAFMGLAFSADDSLLYVSAGNDGAVAVIDVASMSIAKRVNLNGTFSDGSFKDSYTGDIILSPDGKTLYAIDQANFRVVAIDTASLAVKANYLVGRYPFGVSLSPDGNRLYVVNSGMFVYSPVEGYKSTDAKKPASIFRLTGSHPKRPATV